MKDHLIRVRFTGSPLPGSWIIRLLTSSPYSHVESLLDYKDNHSIAAVMGKGVVIGKINRWLRRETVITIPCTRKQAEKYNDSLFTQLDSKYDWSGLWGWVADRDWQDPSKWFCSELIAYALFQADILKFLTPPHSISPGRLYHLLINHFPQAE